MRNVAGNEIACMSDTNNRVVVQGTTEEGSKFWKKLKIFFGYILLSSKWECFTNERGNQGEGRDVTNESATPARSTSTRTSISRRSRTPSNNIRQEFVLASSLLQRYSFNELTLATCNFRSDNILGEGGFGKVWKGWVKKHGNHAAKPGTGIPVAVKTLNPDGFQGHKEWLAEINYLGELHHPNLVRLIGYSIENDKRQLVYEFMCRGSLEKHLFRRGTTRLTWAIRMKIAIGAANGLAFMHEEASRPIIFRDFKTSNILLDEQYNAKLSDFGLAKDAPEGDDTHVSTQVMGTKGYAAPEYVRTGHLTSKSDVYSFGVVLLEMLTGRRAVEKTLQKQDQNLVEWLRPRLKERSNFRYLMDPRLEGQYPMKAARRAMWLATNCVRYDPKLRPLMSEVVRELKGLPVFDEYEMGAGPSASSSSPSISVTSTTISSISLQRMHVGLSSNINVVGANKYGLITGPASNVPRRFQASPLSQDFPFANPAVGNSSNLTDVIM